MVNKSGHLKSFECLMLSLPLSQAEPLLRWIQLVEQHLAGVHRLQDGHLWEVHALTDRLLGEWSSCFRSMQKRCFKKRLLPVENLVYLCLSKVYLFPPWKLPEVSPSELCEWVLWVSANPSGVLCGFQLALHVLLHHLQLGHHRFLAKVSRPSVWNHTMPPAWNGIKARFTMSSVRNGDLCSCWRINLRTYTQI